MYLYVAFAVLLEVTCNHAFPALMHLEVQSFPNDRANPKFAQDDEPAKGFAISHNGLASSVAEDDNLKEDNIFKLVEGNYPGQRGKRATGSIGRIMYLGARLLKGLFAREKLLTGAKFVKIEKSLLGNGRSRFYEKTGDYNRMVSDFASVKPENVRNLNIAVGVEGKTGEVGDISIMYQRTFLPLAGRSTLILSKTDKHGDVINDYIRYTD